LDIILFITVLSHFKRENAFLHEIRMKKES